MVKRLIFLAFLFTQTINAQPKTDFKFSFGLKEVPGYIKVDPSVKYSEEPGYGFDFGTTPSAIYREGNKPLTSGLANSFHREPDALNDNTHFNSYGAYQLAKCIIEGIRANNLGIKKYLLKGLPAFDPAKPDLFNTFSLPLSPHSPVIVTN